VGIAQLVRASDCGLVNCIDIFTVL
jgi:hypothetical protein